MERFKVPTHFLVLKSVSMCTTEWITNFGFSIEASEKRCQKISTRPKMFDNGFISRHFVTIFETAKSTHDKLNQNVYFVVFLFSYSFHSHGHCTLACIDPESSEYEDLL